MDVWSRATQARQLAAHAISRAARYRWQACNTRSPCSKRGFSARPGAWAGGGGGGGAVAAACGSFRPTRGAERARVWSSRLSCLSIGIRNVAHLEITTLFWFNVRICVIARGIRLGLSHVNITLFLRACLLFRRPSSRKINQKSVQTKYARQRDTSHKATQSIAASSRTEHSLPPHTTFSVCCASPFAQLPQLCARSRTAPASAINAPITSPCARRTPRARSIPLRVAATPCSVSL